MDVRSALLTNARVVDLETGAVTPNVWLRFEGGRIAATGAGEVSPGDAFVEDLGGAFVLPGLWDVHCHLGFEGEDLSREESAPEYTARCIGAAVRAVRAGITSVRSAGEGQFIDCVAKRFFDEGTVVGPRIVPAGYALTTTAGHATELDQVGAVDGPAAFRNAVRENIRHGAEHLKLVMSGGIWGPAWDNIDSEFFTPDELGAAFGTAKQRGLPVMAHAAGAAAVKTAVRYGARTVEHGYALDEEAVEMMAEAGTVFVPTLTMSQLSAGIARDEYEKAHLGDRAEGIPADILAKALAYAEKAEWGFRAAVAAGVTIGCGADTPPIAEGAKLEVALMVRFGMTPREALLTATKNAAELSGYGEVSGSLEPGKDADVLAVETDPLLDVYSVRRVKAVWRRGVRVT